MTKAIFFLAVLTFAAADSRPASAQAFSDEEFCREMTEIAKTVNRRNPSWIDRNIRNDGMAVLCLQKTIEYRIYMKVEPANMMEDWEIRHQAHWSLKNCQEPMLTAIRNGWRIVEILRIPRTPSHGIERQHRAVAVCG